jgi:hypothetical protein
LTDPLFLGIDTPALSEVGVASALRGAGRLMAFD